MEEDEGGNGPQFCVPDGPQDDGGPPQDGNSRVAGSIAIAIAAAGQASRPWLHICGIQEEAQRLMTKKLIPYFFFCRAKRGAPAMVFLDVIVNVCCRRLLHREEYSFE